MLWGNVQELPRTKYKVPTVHTYCTVCRVWPVGIYISIVVCSFMRYIVILYMIQVRFIYLATICRRLDFVGCILFVSVCFICLLIYSSSSSSRSLTFLDRRRELVSLDLTSIGLFGRNQCLLLCYSFFARATCKTRLTSSGVATAVTTY